jgi:hypothetical protein
MVDATAERHQTLNPDSYLSLEPPVATAREHIIIVLVGVGDRGAVRDLVARHLTGVGGAGWAGHAFQPAHRDGARRRRRSGIRAGRGGRKAHQQRRRGEPRSVWAVAAPAALHVLDCGTGDLDCVV